MAPSMGNPAVRPRAGPFGGQPERRTINVEVCAGIDCDSIVI
jgi:hypothetical protein